MGLRCRTYDDSTKALASPVRIEVQGDMEMTYDRGYEDTRDSRLEHLLSHHEMTIWRMEGDNEGVLLISDGIDPLVSLAR